MFRGYARVSIDDQQLYAQITAPEEAGVECSWSEIVSGSKADRDELTKMVEQSRSGYVFIVTRYVRPSRLLQDLLAIVETIRERGAGIGPLVLTP